MPPAGTTMMSNVMLLDGTTMSCVAWLASTLNVAPPPTGTTIVVLPAGTPNVVLPAGMTIIAPPAGTSNIALLAGTTMLNVALPAGTMTSTIYLLASKTNAVLRKCKRHNHKKNVKACKLQMKSFGFGDYAQGAAAIGRLTAASVRPVDGFGDHAQGTAAVGRLTVASVRPVDGFGDHAEGTAAIGRWTAASVRPVEWGDDEDNTSSDDAVQQLAARRNNERIALSQR